MKKNGELFEIKLANSKAIGNSVFPELFSKYGVFVRSSLT